MMRESCGANDHPDSILFIQMYKLISTYSLIKPPKGCNVEGGEILESILQLKDIENKSERKEQWEGMIDTIIDKGSKTHFLGEASRLLLEHNYSMSETSEYAITYISGYCSRRASRFAKFSTDNTKRPVICYDCQSSLVLSENAEIPERHKLINLKTRGFLKHPSLDLFDLISILEVATLATIKDKDVNDDSIFQITEALDELCPIPFVGCKEHSPVLTKKVITFYLTMRMFFITKQYNKMHNRSREFTREKRKTAKLSEEKRKELNVVDKSKQKCCDVSNKTGFKRKRPRKRKSSVLQPKRKKKKVS